MSWFVHCGDWIFNCTSACVPSLFPHPPMCLFQAGRNGIHSGCQCFPSFRERVCRLFLCHYCSSWSSCSGVLGTGHAHLYPVVCFATSATRRSICGTLFDGICVKPPTSSTTMTTLSSVTLLWLTTVSLILRRPPIMCCAVVGCIMPRSACRLWPTITHCMNVRFGFEALQLLFCSFFLFWLYQLPCLATVFRLFG